MRRVAAAVPGAQGDAFREHFIGLLLANLDPADLGFLTRIAILDHLHAGLCDALLAVRRRRRAPGCGCRATRRSSSPPKAANGCACTAWRAMCCANASPPCRAAERATVHARAADWLAAHGLLEAAAGHALAGGADRPRL